MFTYYMKFDLMGFSLLDHIGSHIIRLCYMKILFLRVQGQSYLNFGRIEKTGVLPQCSHKVSDL